MATKQILTASAGPSSSAEGERAAVGYIYDEKRGGGGDDNIPVRRRQRF